MSPVTIDLSVNFGPEYAVITGNFNQKAHEHELSVCQTDFLYWRRLTQHQLRKKGKMSQTPQIQH
jgi:hypothetical protein